MLKPKIFITDDLTAYGLRKPAWYRFLVVLVGRVLRLHKPVQTTARVTDPTTFGSNPTEEQKRGYFAERVDIVKQLIDKLGWRAAFITSLAELPQEQTFKETDRTVRVTVFYVF